MKRASILGALGALFLCAKSWAVAGGQIAVDGYLLANPVQAYSSTFSIRTDGMNWASAESVVSSATVANGTFSDGSASTGSLTVVSFTALSSATATGTSMKISSDTALAGACISGGGLGLGAFNVCNPANWALDVVTASNTACNIAAAIQATGIVLSTCSVGTSAGIIYSTATYPGSIWNGFGINSSSITALSSSTFSGGQDNQSFSINGKTFVANRDFFPVTSTAQTATNIATAISNSSTSINVVASALASVVRATSTVVGVAANYVMTSSSNTALSLSPTVIISGSQGTGAMTGGTNSAYVIGTSTISIPGNTFGTGQAVLYTQGVNAIVGLTNQTTYFVIDIPPTTIGPFIMLSASSTGAVLGAPAIVLNSSQTLAAADTYTLAPLAITGTPSLKWVVSNDNINWIPFTTTPLGQPISSATYSAYNSTGTVTIYDFGHLDYGYLGASLTGPLTGALNAAIKIIGKQN